ncbi:3-oxoacid CoA-transferase subunit B [Nocardioides sp.]|uniref:3-oxoacid CoA-transferase subunit B n=1 Tax=Nocardioides sp. TaxID=35761 RepID=UPI003D12C283
MSRGWTRDQVAARAAKELRDGDYVNLGIGLPTRVADHVGAAIEVVVHSENGVLRIGPSPAPGHEDPELINAGTEFVTVGPGASFVSSSDSFAMIRGGHIDVTILGAMQVSAGGDLANWIVPGQLVKGIGGAMDLAIGARRVIVLMDHVAKDGSFKLVERCSLPLTGRGVVNRVISDLGVIDITPEGFAVTELAPGIDFEEVASKTGARIAKTVDRFPLSSL